MSRRGAPNWKNTSHELFISKRGKIYVDKTTGLVFDQKGNSLPADETITSVCTFEVPDTFVQRILAIQEGLAQEFYGAEIEQAMQEARRQKMAEIKARDKKSKTAAKKAKKLVREDVIEDDDDEFDDDDLDDELDAELVEAPKPAKKLKKPGSSAKKKK